MLGSGSYRGQRYRSGHAPARAGRGRHRTAAPRRAVFRSPAVIIAVAVSVLACGVGAGAIAWLAVRPAASRALPDHLAGAGTAFAAEIGAARARGAHAAHQVARHRVDRDPVAARSPAPGPRGRYSGTLSCAGLESLWRAAGGSAAAQVTAAGVAMAGSGGRQYATGAAGKRGYWQIPPAHGALSTYDPLGNARAAVRLSSDGANWSRWTAYVSGAYLHSGCVSGRATGYRTMVDGGPGDAFPASPDLVAGGPAWTAEDFARFPSAVHIRIDHYGTHPEWEVIDYERSYVFSPDALREWVVERLKYGPATVYCWWGNYPAVAAALQGLPWSWWVADQTGVPHAFDAPAGWKIPVATQWQGGGPDISLVTDPSWYPSPG